MYVAKSTLRTTFGGKSISGEDNWETGMVVLKMVAMANPDAAAELCKPQ